MKLQHVNVKLLLAKSEEVDLEPLIPIFHGWIQDQNWGELLLDVADYRHVYASPGILLIGHEGNYSVDNTDNRLGVRYNRKAAFNGSNQDRLIQATLAALKACERLQQDPRLHGKLHFNGQEIEISVNDRLLAPNTPAARATTRAELVPYLQRLFAENEYSLTFDDDPRGLIRAHVKASRPFSVTVLSENLGSARIATP